MKNETEKKIRAAEKRFADQKKKKDNVTQFVGELCKEGAKGSTDEVLNQVARGVFKNPDLVIIEW